MVRILASVSSVIHAVRDSSSLPILNVSFSKESESNSGSMPGTTPIDPLSGGSPTAKMSHAFDDQHTSIQILTGGRLFVYNNIRVSISMHAPLILYRN